MTELGRPVDAQSIRIGAWFARDFQHYFSGWSVSPDGGILGVILREDIIDFDSFRTAWALEQGKWIASRLYPQAEPATPQAALEAPSPHAPPRGVDFSFVRNERLRRIAERDYTERRKNPLAHWTRSGRV